MGSELTEMYGDFAKWCLNGRGEEAGGKARRCQLLDLRKTAAKRGLMGNVTGASLSPGFPCGGPMERMDSKQLFGDIDVFAVFAVLLLYEVKDGSRWVTFTLSLKQ